MAGSRGRALALAAPLLCGACGDGPMDPDALRALGGPALEPDRYFEGRAVSFGVFEDRGGAPTGRFSTESEGRREADGTLVLDQTVRLDDGTVQRRQWRMRRVDARRYEATAGPVEGVARGEADGRTFHWTYTIALPPGDWLHRVEFEHRMYLADDGRTLLNRFTVRKLGLVVSRASEVFDRRDAR